MINQGRTVPLTFRLVGMVIVIVAVVFSMQIFSEVLAILLAMVLSLIVPMLWFSFQIITIDPSAQEIHYGTWLMGYKTGKPKKYHSLDKIFINRVKTSQTMYSRSNTSHTAKGVEYHAYLKFNEEEKIFLASDKDEKRLEDKMIKIREKLDLS